MADERDDDRNDRESDYQPARGGALATTPAGFFHIYKPGQGYWTRMCTAGAALLIILLTGHFFWQQLPVWSEYVRANQGVRIGIAVGVIIALSLLAFWITNKPKVVDFLVATDSEMKKVNWTSKRELIGSTKVVILFVFSIAALLFLIDLFFGYLFYLFKVLKQAPLG